ncbi:MAG TPA: hypothetical protein VMM78_15060 [Thermomicrobiales bacterium]|nr:hypothetical protein [Thermomicrobiales bacterium]
MTSGSDNRDPADGRCDVAAVSGPWRITFRWDGKDAHWLALEQYH